MIQDPRLCEIKYDVVRVLQDHVVLIFRLLHRNKLDLPSLVPPSPFTRAWLNCIAKGWLELQSSCTAKTSLVVAAFCHVPKILQRSVRLACLPCYQYHGPQ